MTTRYPRSGGGKGGSRSDGAKSLLSKKTEGVSIRCTEKRAVRSASQGTWLTHNGSGRKSVEEPSLRYVSRSTRSVSRRANLRFVFLVESVSAAVPHPESDEVGRRVGLISLFPLFCR